MNDIEVLIYSNKQGEACYELWFYRSVTAAKSRERQWQYSTRTGYVNLMKLGREKREGRDVHRRENKRIWNRKIDILFTFHSTRELWAILLSRCFTNGWAATLVVSDGALIAVFTTLLSQSQAGLPLMPGYIHQLSLGQPMANMLSLAEISSVA